MLAAPKRMAPEAASRTRRRRDPNAEASGASMTCVAVIAASVLSVASSIPCCVMR